MRGDLPFEILAQRSLAHDLTAKAEPRITQSRTGLHQVGETLLFHQSSDGEDERRVVGCTRRRRDETLQIDPVVYAYDPFGRDARSGEIGEPSLVELAHRDDTLRAQDQDAQQPPRPTAQVDVFRMR